MLENPKNINEEKHTPSIMERMRNHMKLGLTMSALASLTTFFEACQTSNPSNETLQKLLETNPNIQTIGFEEMEHLQSLIDLAKERKTEVLFEDENDSLKRSVEVDTVKNRVALKTENKIANPTSNTRASMNKFYILNKENGFFNFVQTSTEHTILPTTGSFSADLETGVINTAFLDVAVDPDVGTERKGPQSFVIKTDGTLDGNLDLVKQLRVSYLKGLKTIQILSIEALK